MTGSHEQTHREQSWRLAAVIVDVIMLALILVNLGLILFDWLFGMAFVQQSLATYLPHFFVFYRDQIHAHFAEIDLAFVAVYLIEFGVQWLVAIWRKVYYRWFFYPFIHWYDLLGCIPVGDFRWLRVLRVFSILLRLQQLGWIDLRTSYLGRVVGKYYRMLVEEISDRVVVNVLDGAQREIAQGSPVLNRIQNEVLVPRKALLLGFASQQIATRVQTAHQQNREGLETYLGQLADEVLARSTLGRTLHALPFANRVLRQQIQQLGLALVDSLVEDISAEEHRARLVNVLDAFLQTPLSPEGQVNTPLAPLIQDLLHGIIEQIKQQVMVQQWKLGSSDLNTPSSQD